MLAENLDVEETEEETAKSTPKKDEDTGLKKEIDHQTMGLYANDTFELNDGMNSNIKICITGNETRGNTFSKYTVYVIRGEDKNGEINVCRRFK